MSGRAPWIHPGNLSINGSINQVSCSPKADQGVWNLFLVVRLIEVGSLLNGFQCPPLLVSPLIKTLFFLAKE